MNDMATKKLTEAQRNTERGDCDFCGEVTACAVSDHRTTVRICGPCAQWAIDMLTDAGRAALKGGE